MRKVEFLKHSNDVPDIPLRTPRIAGFTFTSRLAAPGTSFPATQHPRSDPFAVPAVFFPVSPNLGFNEGVDVSRITAVPEPSIFALLAGFAGLGLVLWRRRRR